MQHILVVADVSWVRNEVHAALTTPDFDLIDLDDPDEAAATAASKGVDAVVVDLQVGSMGGMAVVRDVRDRCNADGKQPPPGASCCSIVLPTDSSPNGPAPPLGS